jgi:hypothetical protein
LWIIYYECKKHIKQEYALTNVNVKHRLRVNMPVSSVMSIREAGEQAEIVDQLVPKLVPP